MTIAYCGPEDVNLVQSFDFALSSLRASKKSFTDFVTSSFDENRRSLERVVNAVFEVLKRFNGKEYFQPDHDAGHDISGRGTDYNGHKDLCDCLMTAFAAGYPAKKYEDAKKEVVTALRISFLGEQKELLFTKARSIYSDSTFGRFSAKQINARFADLVRKIASEAGLTKKESQRINIFFKVLCEEVEKKLKE
jgi:nucleoid DNA-binding protein